MPIVIADGSSSGLHDPQFGTSMPGAVHPIRNDARALAQIMRTGWYRQVHVKSRQCRLWRSLLVARRTVLNEMRSIENVVRAVLREGGIKLGTPSRAAFAGRVRELAGGDPLVRARVEPLLSIHAGATRPPDEAGPRHRP
jgi:transposase